MEKKDLTFTFDPNDLGSMCELMDKYGDITACWPCQKSTSGRQAVQSSMVGPSF